MRLRLEADVFVLCEKNADLTTENAALKCQRVEFEAVTHHAFVFDHRAFVQQVWH